jgi:hypothetical protein
VSAISRAVAIARARASLAFRDSERCAEYSFFGAGAFRAVEVRTVFLVPACAESAWPMPILTRQTTTKRPIQRNGFLRTFSVPAL